MGRQVLSFLTLLIIGTLLLLAHANKELDEESELYSSEKVGKGLRVPRSKPTEEPPEICVDGTIDAILSSKAGSIYIFKGKFYWRVDPYRRGIDRGYPRLIEWDWKGLPSNIDAGFYASYTGYTFFFNGDKVYKFNGHDAIRSYPRQIANEFRGVPNDVTAAFSVKNQCFYFIKDHEYYKYCYQQSENPKSLRETFGTLPYHIDAAFQHQEDDKKQYTYFFSGKEFYRYNDSRKKLDGGFPRSTAAWWLNCDPDTKKPKVYDGSPAAGTVYIKSSLMTYMLYTLVTSILMMFI